MLRTLRVALALAARSTTVLAASVERPLTLSRNAAIASGLATGWLVDHRAGRSDLR